MCLNPRLSRSSTKTEANIAYVDMLKHGTRNSGKGSDSSQAFQNAPPSPVRSVDATMIASRVDGSSIEADALDTRLSIERAIQGVLDLCELVLNAVHPAQYVVHRNVALGACIPMYKRCVVGRGWTALGH